MERFLWGVGSFGIVLINGSYFLFFGVTILIVRLVVPEVKEPLHLRVGDHSGLGHSVGDLVV